MDGQQSRNYSAFNFGLWEANLTPRLTLLGKPWNRASADIPEEIYQPKGMLGGEERRALFWLTDKYYEGQGFIIDAGAYVGASAFCLASGLARRQDLPLKTPTIFSYDYFEAIDSYVVSQLSNDFGSCQVEDNFFDKFQLQTKKYQHLIRAIPGDFLRQHWDASPIEILFIDVAKTRELNSHIVSEFFPYLIPGRSLVIQQDFYHCWHPYIHITMEFFKEYFDIIDRRIDVASRLYFYKKKIPDYAIEAIASYRISSAQRLAFLDRYVGSETGDDQAMAKVVRLRQLVEDQEWKAAKNAYSEITEDYRAENNEKPWRIQAEQVASCLVGK